MVIKSFSLVVPLFHSDLNITFINIPPAHVTPRRTVRGRWQQPFALLHQECAPPANPLLSLNQGGLVQPELRIKGTAVRPQPHPVHLTRGGGIKQRGPNHTKKLSVAPANYIHPQNQWTEDSAPGMFLTTRTPQPGTTLPHNSTSNSK